MNPLISSQAFDFIVLFFCGILIAILRQVYNFLQSRYPSGKPIAFLQEMLFWLLSAILVSSSLYYCCFGALSIHAFAGFTLGAFSWYNIRKIGGS